MQDLWQKFKEIVDRTTILRISKCLECGEIVHSRCGTGEGLYDHFLKTGHSRFEAIGHVYLYATEEDARWMDEFAMLQRKAFEKLKESEQWKVYERKLREILGNSDSSS